MQLVLGDLAIARDGAVHRLGDRLLVWLPRGVDAGAGDRLLVVSRVELAEDFDGFAYREYLERQGVGAIARARSAEVVAQASGPAAVLAGLRATLLGGLNDLVPEPEAALGAGILLGVRSAIAPEINDAFATAGLTHVVAISGWNIAIVAALVAAAVQPLARRPGGRWTTAAVAAATVGGYVLLTGASPSVVRAALMAAAMLVARLGGSRAHAASALALAALVMLLAAPPVLWDVGFQLSLLATAGLVWFGAPIERRLHRWPGWIREPVALTLAAQLTTLPVILVNFERLSLVAPIANVLVVPFVPVAMLFSAIASIAGVLDAILPVPVIGGVMTWLAGGAAWLVLRVIVWLGTTVASVPHAAVDVDRAAAAGGRLAADAGAGELGDPRARCGAARRRRPTARRAGSARPVRRVARPLPIGAGAGGRPAGDHGRVAPGRAAAPDRARHRSGGRHPDRGARRHDHARRRRAGSRADPATPWREPAVLRPSHRPARAQPSAPGPRRRARRRAGPPPRRRRPARRDPVREPGQRPPPDRCGPCRHPDRSGARRPSPRSRGGHVGHRPLSHAGRRRRAAARGRHQQRLDRAAPRVGRVLGDPDR